MTVIITRHCAERLKERIAYLREAEEGLVMSKLNFQLSKGILYEEGERNVLLLGFDNTNFRFVVVDDKNGLYHAVTFEHSMRFPRKGKEVNVKYVHWKDAYTNNRNDELLRRRTD